MNIVIKIGLIALVVTAVISIPMGIILYRYMQNKMASYDYDTSGDGWIKWESEEQWENWDFTGEMTRAEAENISKEEESAEIEKSDKETLLQTHYSNDCMMKRNKYMVDKSDFVIAVWNGDASGTGNTVRYAKENNKTIIQIKP